MGKYVVKETKTGIKFDLKASNGEVIATSEVYSSKASCLIGVESLKRNGPIANVDDLTLESKDKVSHPKYEVYLDKAGEYRFRIKARNGEIIAVSEGYKEKRSCLNGIESVRKNSATSETEDLTESDKDKGDTKNAAQSAPMEKIDESAKAKVETGAGKLPNIEAGVEEIVAKINADKALASEFKRNPSAVVESLLGTKLPDEQMKPILETIETKLGKKKGGFIAAIKRFLGIK